MAENINEIILDKNTVTDNPNSSSEDLAANNINCIEINRKMEENREEKLAIFSKSIEEHNSLMKEIELKETNSEENSENTDMDKMPVTTQDILDISSRFSQFMMKNVDNNAPKENDPETIRLRNDLENFIEKLDNSIEWSDKFWKKRLDQLRIYKEEMKASFAEKMKENAERIKQSNDDDKENKYAKAALNGAKAKGKAKSKADAEARVGDNVEAEPETKVEAEAKVDAEAETKPKSEAKVEAEAETKSNAGAKVEAEAETKANAGAKPKVEAEAVAEAEAKTKIETETEAEAKAKAATKVETEAEAIAKAEAEAKDVAKSEAETKVETETEAEAVAKTEAETKDEAESRANVETSVEAEAECKSEAESEAKPEAESEVEVVENVKEGEEEDEIISNARELTEVDVGPTANDDKYKHLLDMLFNLEEDKQKITDESNKNLAGARKQLMTLQCENDKLRRRVQELEQMVNQSVLLNGGESAAPKSKQELEELLLKAKSLLFEKSKINKRQEVQIEGLKTQVKALKDVARLSKDMLNLKIAECEHNEARLEFNVVRNKAEREKCALLEKKLEVSKAVYNQLKIEHDKQSKIFKELRESYTQKINLLNKTIDTMKRANIFNKCKKKIKLKQ